MQRLLDGGVRFLALPVLRGNGTTFGELLAITWFGLFTGLLVYAAIVSTGFAWDAVLYTHAAQALLEGGDPWAAVERFGRFAGPPPSLLPYLPTAWLPDVVVAAVWTVIPLVSAIYILRRLRLPLWWLLFPPVSLAILTGSSTLPVMALIVRGGALADGAAIAARVYSAVPLAALGRWRGFVVAAAIVVASAPFLGWPQFIDQLPAVSDALREQTDGGQSAAAVPWLIPVAAVCLLLLGRRRAAWLLVPALWPFTQGYYAVIALPVVAQAPLVALALSVNDVPGAVVVGLVAQVAVERLGIWRPRPTAPGEPDGG